MKKACHTDVVLIKTFDRRLQHLNCLLNSIRAYYLITLNMGVLQAKSQVDHRPTSYEVGIYVATWMSLRDHFLISCA